MAKKKKEKVKEEEKPVEKKIEPRIKEIKKEEKTAQELEIDEEFFNEESLESELSESIGRALPIIRSGMIQEKGDNLEEFADTLPSRDSEEKDKGYVSSKTGYADSYTTGKKYETAGSKNYESTESFAEARREVEKPDDSASLAQERKLSSTEKESKESLEHFARQQERYGTQREQESTEAPFRHKEKREF